MSWASITEKTRPTLIVGKTSTGKTTIALSMLDNPVVYFADEFDGGVPSNTELLIEDVHHKPNTKEIVEHLRRATGKVVLTSINKKSVPKQIINMCKLNLAGSTTHLPFADIAPRSVPTQNTDMEIFDLLKIFLRNRDRDEVAKILKRNKPTDVFMLNALSDHVHFNRLLFVDARVKRRWPQAYFYEMLAYAYQGGNAGRFGVPKFAQNKDRRRVLRRLGFRPTEWNLLMDVIKSTKFQKYTQTKLNNKEYRLLGLGEKPIKRKKKEKKSIVTLGDY